MRNFIKINYIKFRKAALHNWAKRKYIASENKKQKKVDASFLKCATLFSQGKNEKAVKMAKDFQFSPVENTLYELIKYFTYRELDEAKISNMIDSLKNVGIEAKIENDILFISSEELNFQVLKLSRIEPKILIQLIDIEKPSRGGKCHPYGVVTALCYNNNKNFKAHFVTGRIFQLSPRAKYLHSWVEIEEGKNVYVIDPTRNSIYPKDAFYQINHVGETVKIHSKDLKVDYPMIRALTDYDGYAVKVYYENPERGRRLYKKLVELGEIEDVYKNEKSLD